MTMWLYQLSQIRDRQGHYLPTEEQYPPSEFRREIRENKKTHWPYRKVKGEERPKRGDVLVFFYTPTGEKEPGIYGWADVIRNSNDEAKQLYFMPKPPTKHLMSQPWWDDNVKHIVDKIRGGFKQGTLWPVDDLKLVQTIREGIADRAQPFPLTSQTKSEGSGPAVLGPFGTDVPEGLPPTIEGTCLRIVRNTELCLEVKKLYGYRCQVCGLRLELKPGVFYAEGHHVRRLGGGHKGLDVRGNILCLCPNHHVLFDNFAIRLDPARLRLKKHDLRQSFVDYHNAQVTKQDHPSR